MMHFTAIHREIKDGKMLRIEVGDENVMRIKNVVRNSQKGGRYNKKVNLIIEQMVKQ